MLQFRRAASRGALACALLGAGFGVCVLPAVAQTASQLTPPSFQPQIQRDGAALKLAGPAAAALPADAEQYHVLLNDVVVEGAPPALDPAVARARAGLIGRRVSAADIFRAARQLEAEAAAEGRVLVRVLVPEQRIEDGQTLRLALIDGFIETIDTQSLPRAVRARVAAVLAPLIGRPGIGYREIERRLLLAGDTPGVMLRSTLAAGIRPGGSQLVIEARYRPVGGIVSMDNGLSAAFGNESYGLGINLNSVLGMGELIYLRANGQPFEGDYTGARPRNRALAAGYVLPVGIDGLTLNVEYSASRATPRTTRFEPPLGSDFSRLAVRASYPLVRSQALNDSVSLGFDMSRETLDYLGAVKPIALARDRLRVVRLSNDLRLRSADGATLTLLTTLSAGLDAFGARTPADAAASRIPLSRQGARPDFRSLLVTVDYAQPVGRHFALALRSQAQTSFGIALPNAERIGLTGANGLSAMESGAMLGDAGLLTRGEVQAPFSGTFAGARAAMLAVPYAFVAGGAVNNARPTILEREWVSGAAYGLGIRMGIAPRASQTSANVTLELGRSTRSDRAGTSDRFTTSFNLQF